MKETTERNSESFAVLEMPMLAYGIRMDLTELKRFCKEYRLPLFCLRVEEEVDRGVSTPLRSPWRKYFTLKWDWYIWAAEKDEEKAPSPLFEPVGSSGPSIQVIA